MGHQEGPGQKRSWSGVTANQLFLFPGDADFEKKDFTCQISTATVDVEESTFTPFEGFDRIIMTTDNDFGLVHDFNCIMDRKTCRGETTAMTLSKGSVLYPRKGNYGAGLELEIIYCAAGRLTFRYGETEERLDQGDVLVIDHGLMDSRYCLSNEEDQPCDLVVTLIRVGLGEGSAPSFSGA